ATLSGPPYTGSFTITAQGGSVSYSIADPAPAGDLAISPSAGTLSAGQSVTVSVTVVTDAGLASETDLAVNPGGLLVAVIYPPGESRPGAASVIPAGGAASVIPAGGAASVIPAGGAASVIPAGGAASGGVELGAQPGGGLGQRGQLAERDVTGQVFHPAVGRQHQA